MNQTKYTEVLCRMRWEDLPEPVKHQSKRCLKDILATGAGGYKLPPAQQMADLVLAQYADGPVPLWFTGRRSALVGACFFNAFMVDGLDWHDGFRLTKGHAGATVVPTAVGVCAAGSQVSGQDLLTAIVIGYEIACRAGLAVHSLYAPAYHTSGSWASLGAAAAGCKLRAIPAADIDAVLGMAEYYAPISPMIRCTESPSPLKDGAAAGAWSAGMALQMYQRGLRGLPSLLTAEPQGRAQMDSLGQDWIILRQYFKPYTTCRWAQPPVECLRQLKKEHGFSNDQIDSIVIETFREAATLGQFPPQDTDGAQYSIVWAAAAMLADGDLKLAQIHPDRLNDPEILQIGKKIRCEQSAEIQVRFPAECLARVRIVLKDGRRLQSSTLGAQGDYESPLSDEEIDDKFLSLVSGRIGQKKAAKMKTLLDKFEHHNSGDLLAFL
ncbi:MAG TPA: MmgE/PrpD family protein [Anaerohalosphaeraceae bacterium]|nr:MmgE/PrpD family protein [Anaerohalosphaeraceae bacterium]